LNSGVFAIFYFVFRCFLYYANIENLEGKAVKVVIKNHREILIIFPSFIFLTSPSGKELPRQSEEHQYAKGIEARHHPESGYKSKILRQHTSEQYTKAESAIPGYEYGRIGGAPLVMIGYAYKHIEKSGIHVAIAQTYQQG
jgi:hypothetical protein